MINIESIVYGILSADSTVAASFSTRIYPMITPNDSDLPAITYRISGLERYETQVAASNVDKYFVGLSVYSLTYSGLYALCEMVKDAMLAQTSSILYRIFLTNISDEIQEIYTTADPTVSTGQYLYIRNLDFSIFKK